MEVLPGQIEELQSEVERYHLILADNDLFTVDPQNFQAAVDGLNEVQAKLAEAEERWLNLEIRRDEIKSR